eukprot:374713-Hanusia_phi.AAC.3
MSKPPMFVTQVVQGTCDKCDGAHPTDSCPIYKKKREDHPDAWRNFGRKTPLEMGEEEEEEEEEERASERGKSMRERGSEGSYNKLAGKGGGNFKLRSARVISQPGDG